jgi:2-polyprenyl-6-methoxyphenol hydroxylase-like FAD-dependent oxidoreductase
LPSDHPILIVGGGLGGLTTALALAQRGRSGVANSAARLTLMLPGSHVALDTCQSLAQRRDGNKIAQSLGVVHEAT